MSRWITKFGVTAALVLGLAASAGASPLTFSFTGENFLTPTGGSHTWTQGGITLTGTAWYANSNSIGMARLGGYAGYGLGVCNGAEDNWQGTCSSPEHGVDNMDEYDFVLFSFSAPVDLSQVSLFAFGYDTDVSFWIGNGVTTMSGRALNNMPAALGFRQDVDNSVTINLDNTTNTYTSLLFGAQTTSSNDAFKIKSLTIDVPDVHQTEVAAVPEPATLSLLGLGLLGSAAMLRRRQ